MSPRMASRFSPLERVSTWRKLSVGMWGHPTSPVAQGEREIDLSETLPWLEAVSAKSGKKITVTHLFVAAVGRMRFLGNPGNPALVMLVWSSPILLAMAYDFARRRIVHPVYVLGLVLMLLESPMVRRVARGTEMWRSISGWFVTFVD